MNQSLIVIDVDKMDEPRGINKLKKSKKKKMISNFENFPRSEADFVDVIEELMKAAKMMFKIDSKIHTLRMRRTGFESRMESKLRRKLFKDFRNYYLELNARDFIIKSFMTDVYLFQ